MQGGLSASKYSTLFCSKLSGVVPRVPRVWGLRLALYHWSLDPVSLKFDSFRKLALVFSVVCFVCKAQIDFGPSGEQGNEAKYKECNYLGIRANEVRNNISGYSIVTGGQGVSYFIYLFNLEYSRGL